MTQTINPDTDQLAEDPCAAGCTAVRAISTHDDMCDDCGRIGPADEGI